jgi:hypothetical protein
MGANLETLRVCTFLLAVVVGFCWAVGLWYSFMYQSVRQNSHLVHRYMVGSWRYLVRWPVVYLLRQGALLVLWLVSLPLGHANRGITALQRRLRARP